MIVSEAIRKMIDFYEGSHHDINHFQKVWTYARMIGELEGLDRKTQQTLELAAVVHDIACPLCREKYGCADGKYQQIEGMPLTREFFADFDLPREVIERIVYLVGHHHTVDCVDGMDYRILLEADYLVNADEQHAGAEEIRSVRETLFETKTGTALLNSVFKL